VTAEALSAAQLEVAARLRGRGQRWTAQRRLVVEVLGGTDGHVTGSELVERCRARDPETTPSTVYRTLDLLEELGVVRHGHGADGREEFHVRPAGEHGHLHCDRCGRRWEIEPSDASGLVDALRERHDVAVDLSHLTVVGRCATCREADGEGPIWPG
jgi:Fur family transcriptional regulator, ferric uptake regulator